MFNLKISGIAESVYIRQGWATKAIGLIDPNVETPVSVLAPLAEGHVDQQDFHKANENNYHIEQFHDVDKITPIYVVPSKEHIENCLAFSDSFTDNDNVLIHCHAGISRSSAIAIAVLLHHGISVDDVMEKLEEIRPEAWPNDLIVQYTDEIFELDGKLIAAVNKWKTEKHSQFYIPGSHTKTENIDSMKELLKKLSVLEDQTLVADRNEVLSKISSKD